MAAIGWRHRSTGRRIGSATTGQFHLASGLRSRMRNCSSFSNNEERGSAVSIAVGREGEAEVIACPIEAPLPGRSGEGAWMRAAGSTLREEGNALLWAFSQLAERAA